MMSTLASSSDSSTIYKILAYGDVQYHLTTPMIYMIVLMLSITAMNLESYSAKTTLLIHYIHQALPSKHAP